MSIPKRIYPLFETLALQAHRRGFRRYSADAVGHLIRWHYVGKGQPNAFNDHWCSDLARWFMRKHPHMVGFFVLRKKRKA